MVVNLNNLSEVVNKVVASTPVVDMHTHLYPGFFGNYLLRGIDSLLTYHYLIAETLRCVPVKPEAFYKLTQTEQADLVWKTLFIERSPVSEACRGVLTVLEQFGLNTEERDLNVYRDFFSSLSLDDHIDLVFAKSGVEYLVMTNDPFDREEVNYWQNSKTSDSRFRAAMRLDKLLNHWEEASIFLQQSGYNVSGDFSGETTKEIRRFLEDMAAMMKPMYLAVSLPPTFMYPEDSPRGKIIKEVVLPFCQDYNLPLALMIGVKKLTNPALELAGDSVGKAVIESVENLCVQHLENKFLVTMLSRENQHELCVAARKFSNLMIFGCWWFLNNPSLITEMTRMRLELLGLSFIPQHSDARVLDQLVYKWKHSRELISEVLVEKYTDLLATGWTLTEEEIQRDVGLLLSQNYMDFLNRK